jgi:glycosyltransferase involved in cell wall biosynthesis
VSPDENQLTAEKLRIGVIGGYYPDYRDAVFARLSQHPDFEFTFLGGSPPTKSFIKASAVKPYDYRPIRTHLIRIPGTPNSISHRSGQLTALLRRKFDALILGNDILAPDVWLCCLLSRVFRVPVCIWGQGLSRPPSRFRDGLRYGLTTLAGAALFYTDSGRDYWIQRGIPREKLFVAYNALDTDQQIQIRNGATAESLDAFLSKEGLEGRRLVAFLGRLIDKKRPRTFIDSVAKVAEREPAVVGVLIGDGPERAPLEQYVRDRGLEKHVRFTGALYDEPTIANYLMSSAGMLLPAFAGLAIQHAAVYGAPIILGDVAHSHGPEQEIVVEGQTGLWRPEDDINAFAGAVLRLMRDAPFRESLSTNLKRVIDEKYNVAAMAQGFIDALHYCLASKSSRGRRYSTQPMDSAV